MLTYKEMKALLKASGERTSHFTEDFYNTFITEKEDSFANYCETGKYLPLTKTEDSDFYKLNGCGYCVMLEIIAEYQPTFKISFYDKINEKYCLNEHAYGDIVSAFKKVTTSFETKEDADLWATAYATYHCENALYHIEKIDNGKDKSSIKEIVKTHKSVSDITLTHVYNNENPKTIKETALIKQFETYFDDVIADSRHNEEMKNIFSDAKSDWLSTNTMPCANNSEIIRGFEDVLVKWADKTPYKNETMSSFETAKAHYEKDETSKKHKVKQNNEQER